MDSEGEQEKIPEEDAGRTTAVATDDQLQATIRKSVDGSEEADWSDKGWGCCGDDTADDATADDETAEETADDSISPRQTHTHRQGWVIVKTLSKTGVGTRPMYNLKDMSKKYFPRLKYFSS